MRRPSSSSHFTSHRHDEQQSHSHQLHRPPPPLSPRSALRSLQGNDSPPRVSNNGQSDATDRRRSSGQHYTPSVMSQPLPKPAGTSATTQQQQQQQQQQAAYTNQRHLSLPSPSWAADGQVSTSPSTSPSLIDFNGPRSPAAPLEQSSGSRRRSMLPPRTSREVNQRYTVPFPPALTQRGSHSSLQSSHSATSSSRASLASLPLATPPESQYSPDYPSFPPLASKHRRLTQEEPGHTRLPRRQASIPRNMRASPRFVSEQEHPFAYSIDDSSARVSWAAGQPADIDGSSSKAQQGDGEYITPPASRFPQLQQHHSYPEWTPSFDHYKPQGSSSPYKRSLDSQPVGPRRSVRSFDDYVTSSTQPQYQQQQQPRPRLTHQSSSQSSSYGETVSGPARSSNSSIASTQSPISDIHMGRRDLDDGPSAPSLMGAGRVLAPLKRSPGISAHQASSLSMPSSSFAYSSDQQQRPSLQPMVASPEQVRTVARTQQTSPKGPPSVFATAAASASPRIATHPPVSPAVSMTSLRQVTQDDGAFEAKLSQARRAPEASLVGPRYPADQGSYPAAPALVAPRRPSDHHPSVRSQSADRAGNLLPEKKDLNHAEVMAKLNRKMKERLAIKASGGGQTLDGRFSPSSPAAIALDRGRAKGRHRGDSNASSSVASSTISASATSTSTVESSPRQSLESLEARAGRTSAPVIGIESLLSAAALSDGMAAQQTQQAAAPNKFFSASPSVSVAEGDRDPQQGRSSPMDTSVPA